MQNKRALAVDVGGTRLRAALVDDSGRIENRIAIPTPAIDGADAVVEAIASACRAILAESDAGENLPVGVCAPGPIDSASGMVLGAPTIRGFDQFPLREAIENALGSEVVIENDGPCAALGEWHFGAGRGARNLAYVTLSTGIGGGLVIDGRLLRGRLGLAGHVGHLPMKPTDGAKCSCGQIGCWEAEASGTALQRKAHAAGFSSLEALFVRATQGEPAALAFVEIAADEIAFGLVALIHMFSPDRIVIGGGVSNAFDVFAPKLRERVALRVLPSFRDVSIVKTALGDNPGLLGASQLAMHPALRTR